MNISALSEFELIARLTAGLSPRSSVDLGVGDDCAVIDLVQYAQGGAEGGQVSIQSQSVSQAGQGEQMRSGGLRDDALGTNKEGSELLLATCDSQVEGVHFTLQTSSPEQIGRKALAINLSDIAAMGGKPGYALVSLVLPVDLALETLDGIYAGLRSEALRYKTAIVGGNIASTGESSQLIIDITLLGSVERGQALLRSGAHVGDVLCVTGSLGDSAAGLYSLLHPSSAYKQEDLMILRDIHTVPRPRVDEGRVLNRFGPQIVTSLLDVSDGLSGDLAHICEQSGVGASVELVALPLSAPMRRLARIAGVEPERWALHGGEDYELLFTVAPGREQEVISAVKLTTGTEVSVIGSIVPASEGMKLLYPDGRQERLAIQSWDHLKQ